jgi:hypothetical protein
MNSQTRITISGLKVAEFASQETLCMTGTILFDGVRIATFENDGHGGATFPRALEGKRGALAEAEAFAATLPPIRYEAADVTIPMTLDMLVDELANEQHEEKRVRAAFKRAQKAVSFVKDGSLYSLKGQKLPATPEQRDLLAVSLRKRYPDAVPLWTLPENQAYAEFKRAAVRS